MGVGKQLKSTVSHMYRTCGVGGGGGGAGHLKQVPPLELLPPPLLLALASHSSWAVDQPLTGRLSGFGWFWKRLPLASCQSSWMAVVQTQIPFGSKPALGTEKQVWSTWQFVV